MIVNHTHTNSWKNVKTTLKKVRKVSKVPIKTVGKMSKLNNVIKIPPFMI